ncbi:MAG: DNA mismatch repair protein MutS [Phycisphaerales bacterium]|nr:DNA mismatch repair protein MutS [Phycisphaerales bacterium]
MGSTELQKPKNTPKSKPAKDPWDTPGMRQWTKIKSEHPDCVLFFRMGDFYELFGEDAENLSRDLGLTLTTRGNAIPMAGVPHHQKPVYLQRAIDHGYRVAVVDQLEDPKEAKGIVARGVTQVVTPGTLVDESLLNEDRRVPLGVISIIDDLHAGIAIVELSTGEFQLFNGSLEQCRDELAKLSVREILFSAPSSGDMPPRVKNVVESIGASGTARPSWHFRIAEASEAIQSVYGIATLDGFGLDQTMPSVCAAGAAIRYLYETQAIKQESDSNNETQSKTSSRQLPSLNHLRAPTLIDRSQTCIIDSVSLRSLEIEQTIREQSLTGSLAGVFLSSPIGTRCVLHTPMGKRLIRSWLSSPLINQDQITQRQLAVSALLDDHALSDALSLTLSSMCDIARISARISLGRATPRDLAALGKSTSLINSLIDTIAPSASLSIQLKQLSSIVTTLDPIALKITRSCVEEPPAHLRAGGLIRDGIDDALDEARGLERDASAWLVQYQQKLSEENNLPSMKVGYNKVFGYYIELPAAQANRAPDIFTRKQTLKNAERYITPELKEFEEKVLTASDRAIERERIIFDQLCEQAQSILNELNIFSDVVATLDCLLGFAIKARERGWCKPEIVSHPIIDIVQGRHPVLDETLGHRFVPNDCTLTTNELPASLALITGPNMAGKSTYIRQNALLAVLAQSGSFIPADAATIGITKRIFTRVGADDALHRGQSTFMVEMIETANILNHADESSLIILDEIGRGTSTLDGLSLAWAICEWLANTTARTLFATHYHEITELEDRLENRVKNLHVAVREWITEDGNQEIAFLHSIRPGCADQSYGIHVAQLAGVPRSVTERAREILDSLSVEHSNRVDTNRVTSPNNSSNNDAQLGLFTEFLPHPVVDALREIKLDTMSPMDAFDALRKLQSQSND